VEAVKDIAFQQRGSKRVYAAAAQTD
jgi:hypothetical protein